uniref:Retrovirus-related Pol polyprotein from transposon TNT 1-94 n=1 Tax=Tanacetum cinerariifolium TaxID=118510 RepID=A0A6L2J5K7_TANCI|nr:retrovirus-related Pol polyprotein from transposon TNT 1-94 [Tanacetum cinerariifolium]
MATTIKQQVALDEALVPSTKRLRIGRSNFILPSDIQSKEPTLHVVCNVLRGCPFFKAFLVTADVPEILMQEFWATAYVHLHSIRFKMDSKKNIVDLEAFREMLHISPRIPGQSFDELPFEEEILDFLRFLRHNVPEIYMQEFWATAKLHQHSIRFKMDTRKSVLDLEAFREMLHISPRIPSQSFAELQFKEEILEFLRFLGHSDEIRHLTDVNVNKLYQPWRSFASVINKCLTGKSSGIDSFRLSQAQILWGLYYRSNVDYAYLIWEDCVYQVEHKNQKRSNDMYYPRFTKVVIDYFMTRKPSIPRRNRINWHYVRDDVLFLQSRWYRDTRLLNNTVRYYRLSSLLTTSGIVRLIRSTMLVLQERQHQNQNESKGESDEEESRQEEEESFDPIPRTPEGSEDEGNDEEDQDLRLSEEARIQEEEEADELYRDRLKSLETTFSEYRQTNQFVDAVSAIPATGSAGRFTTGSQSRQLSANESAFAEEPPRRPPSPDCDWNKTLPAAQGDAQSWISILARKTDALSPFNELLDTPIDFSNFIMNRLDVDTLTLELLVGPTYELMRGSCNSLTELEYHLEEVYKATTDQLDCVNPEGQQQTDARSSFNELLDTPIDISNFIMNRLGVATLTLELLAGPTYELMRGTCNSLSELEYHLEEVYKATIDQLDWVNPEGQQYPHNLLQPLPLIPDNRCHHVIPFKHFINNDLEYLQGGCPDYSLVSRLWMFETYDREPLTDHELSGKFTISRVYYVEGLGHNLFSVVIVDDYSRLTWVRFLRSKDEASEAIIKCIKNIQVRLNATIRNVRTYNGTEFVNQILRKFYENVGISHQTSVACTPQQNDVVERRNRTLVEAARTMLIFSKALLFYGLKQSIQPVTPKIVH